MASISQGLLFTTAMVVSSYLLYLAFHKHKPFPPFQVSCNSSSQKSSKEILRSCLSSGKQRSSAFFYLFSFPCSGENIFRLWCLHDRFGFSGKETKKKKKVKFADNVRESLEKPRKENMKLKRVPSNCRTNIPENRGMPANRIALYNGILRDRVHRMAIPCRYS